MDVLGLGREERHRPARLSGPQVRNRRSKGFVNERALGFKENGGIIFLRSGKDIENPEFADPEMVEIGAVQILQKFTWDGEKFQEEK
jgi:hypothetical protein